MSKQKVTSLISGWRQAEPSIWTFKTPDQFDSARDRFCAATDDIGEHFYNSNKNDVSDYKNLWLAAVDRLAGKQFKSASDAQKILANDQIVSGARRLALEAVDRLEKHKLTKPDSKDKKQSDLIFLPGAFKYRGIQKQLSGKPLRLIEVLSQAQNQTLIKRAIWDQVWEDTVVSDETLRSTIAKARRALKEVLQQLEMDCTTDPLPCVERGEDRAAWRLTLP